MTSDPGSPAARIPTFAIAATFTVEPIQESLELWGHEPGARLAVALAPNGQVLQTLLDPASVIGRNASGLNVVLIRLEDWDGAATDATVDLVEAVRAATSRSAVPLLVCFCPASPASQASDRGRGRAARSHEREAFVAASLAGNGAVDVVTSAQLAATYPVAAPHDPLGDTLGHLPYTPDLFAALGTLAARRLHAHRSPPYKVIAVDCDETLWGGVCGEDGPLGVVIDDARRELQEMLVAQHDAGVLLCLCSKNEEADVAAVFAAQPGMPLQARHIAARRVGWTPKPDALRSLADELGFGLDSFIFLDDNPVERGAVRSGRPEVLTPELPRDPAAIPGFLRGLWALDPRRVTTEDRRRTSLHREESAREQAQLAARSLDDFLAGLELEVGFAPLSAESAARAAQLTQRTNQLNVSTRRRTEAELAALARSGALTGLVIDVRDRFGDYGTVGLLLFAITPVALVVDTLLLSCRALGRGVEQRLLSHLGQLAVAHGRARVDVPFVATARNRPALDLLEAAGAEHREADGEGWIFRLPAASLGAIRRVERAPESRPATERAAKETAPSPAAAGPSAAAQQARRLEHIAAALADVPSILAAIHAQRSGRSARSGGPGSAVAPRGAVEERVAAIWCEVLHLADVSASEVFFALGGDSVAMVRVISRLRDAFGVEITPGQFFGAPTIQGLARTIASLDEAAPAATDADDEADADDEDSALLALIEGLSTTEVHALLGPTISAAPVANAGALTIASIGVVTANRPEALLRALESYAENARRHGHAPDLVVVDDSRAPAMRAANRGALAALSRARGAPIRYAGTEEKEAFLRALGAFDVPPDVARFALLPDVTGTTTVGANRNALLLDAVGDLVFSADDDTLCRLAAPPGSDPAPDPGSLAGRDPCDYWFFRDHAAALRAVSLVDRDLLAAHEELLGRDAQSVGAGEPAGPVLITLGGIVGDCGWGAPFGWWLGPMGYLAMRGASLARLFAEASVSGDPCTSRAILRVARRPSLADETMSMTTTVGLDARGLLPPFCPFGRGEDNIFGASIAACVPGARFGHVPWAVVHAPAEERRFWPGELARTASGVDASRVLIELIRAWDPGDITSPEGRIRALGQHLAEVGAWRGADFDHLVRARLAASNRALVGWLEEGLATPGAPAWWVDETRRFLTALGRAEARDDHAVPLDLRGSGGVDEGRARTQGFVRRMGELYVHWPAMVAGARALRAQGHRPGIAVAVDGRVNA